MAKKAPGPTDPDAVINRLAISHWDADEAREFALILREQTAKQLDHEDRTLRLALTCAVLVSYTRPFSGNSASLNTAAKFPAEYVASLTSAELAMHKELLRLRHKAFAHSDAELADVFRRDLPGQSKAPAMWAKRLPLTSQEVEGVIDLIQRLQSFITATLAAHGILALSLKSTR